MQRVKNFWGILFSQVGFFYIVLLVFMAVSVTESGDFFNKAITHDIFFGSLGYAVAAVFDLLSLVFMLARLNAGRIADRRGQWLSLFGVAVCAAVSAFANMASAVQTYQASQFDHIPAWMSSVAPYLGMVFPAMIIVVSIISDHIGDLNPQRADSIEKYRLKEQKKVDLLRVRLDIERQMAGVKKEMSRLHEKPSKRITQMRQEHAQIVANLRAEHAQIVATLVADYDARINALNTQLEQLQCATTATLTATDDAPNLATKERDTEPLNVVKLRAKKTTAPATKNATFVAKIAAYRERHPEVSVSQIARHFGISVRTVQRHLQVTA